MRSPARRMHCVAKSKSANELVRVGSRPTILRQAYREKVKRHADLAYCLLVLSRFYISLVLLGSVGLEVNVQLAFAQAASGRGERSWVWARLAE